MHILFVCTGNTCRSPMAEHLLRKAVADRGLKHIEVRSAGISPGAALTAETAALLPAEGITGLRHTPAAVTRELVAWADMILAMEESHRSVLVVRFPDATKKTRVIRPGGISDPYGGSAEDYRETLTEISQSISDVVKNLER